jgi:sugar lactone lactonase YvrE
MKNNYMFVAMLIVFATFLSPSNTEAVTGDLLYTITNDNDFVRPEHLAVDDGGQVYFKSGQHGDYAVWVYDRAGNFLNKWANIGDGGIAIANNMGQVYVNAYMQEKIKVYDRAGNFLLEWDCHRSNDTIMSRPEAITIDEVRERIYVTVFGKRLDKSPYNRIQVYDLEGNFIFEWGDQSYSFEPGHFYFPRAISVDENSGHVYVGDYAFPIQVFDSSGNYLFSFEMSRRTRANGIFVDGNNNLVYVTASDAFLDVYDLAGNLLFTFGGPGTRDGQFFSPYGISLDNNGQVYVADNYNGRIQLFDESGTFISKWKGIGKGDEQFSPQAIDIDSDDNIYVSSDVPISKIGFCKVVVLDHDGNFLRQLEYEAPEGSPDYRPCSTSDIFADNESDLIYVLDQKYGQIHVFDISGQFQFKWGESGSGEGQFSYPSSIDGDGKGRIYVTDSRNNRIQVFDQYGNFLFEWGGAGTGDGQFTNPIDVFVDIVNDRVYVAEPNPNPRVQVFDLDGNFLFKWGDFGSTPGLFIDIISITGDDNGNIYLYDRSSYIHAFDATGNFITQWINWTGNAIATDSSGLVYSSGIVPSRNSTISMQYPYPPGISVFEGVGSTNLPPNADAGPDIVDKYSCGNLIELDGSASTDPDGDLLTYTWSGPFGTKTGMTATVTLPLGTHTISLMVNDGKGGTAMDNVEIIVVDITPPVVTSATLNGNELMPGLYLSDVLFVMESTDTCSGVASVSYTVDGIQTVVPQSNASTIISTGGDHVISYKAYDNAGNISEISNLSFSLFEANDSGLSNLTDYFLKEGLIDPQMENSLKTQISTANPNAFINHIEAQSGKKIDPVAAQILIDGARAIMSN